MNKLAKLFRDYALTRFALPVGLILIIFGIYTIGPVAQRLKYPQTEATVIQTELYEETQCNA